MQKSYAIGEVVRMTGLSSHSIRKWEERYGAVRPDRTAGGTRRYRSEDVSRLTLLKELVDGGESIGELAGLDDATLKARCVEALSVGGTRLRGRVRVGVLGDSLPTILAQHGTLMPNLDIVAQPSQAEPVDVLIVEQAGLDERTGSLLGELRDRYAVDQVVVLYGYAPQHVVLRLSDDRTACLRMPVNYVELQRTVLALDPAEQRAADPALAPRRYSKRLLARVSALSTNIDCECPRHVAELLMALTDFESYSASCEDRNPLDAAVHNYLKATAAHARVAFEQALSTVAAHEDIPLEAMAAEE